MGHFIAPNYIQTATLRKTSGNPNSHLLPERTPHPHSFFFSSPSREPPLGFPAPAATPPPPAPAGPRRSSPATGPHSRRSSCSTSSSTLPFPAVLDAPSLRRPRPTRRTSAPRDSPSSTLPLPTLLDRPPGQARRARHPLDRALPRLRSTR